MAGPLIGEFIEWLALSFALNGCVGNVELQNFPNWCSIYLFYLAGWGWGDSLLSTAPPIKAIGARW